MIPRKLSVEEIMRKYGSKIESNVKTDVSKSSGFSAEYLKFKQEMVPEITRYEQWCKSLGSIVKINVSKQDEEKIRRQLETAHLNIEPWQALTLSIMAFAGVFFIGLLISFSVVLIRGSLAAFPTLFFFLSAILAMFLFYFFKEYFP